MIVICAKSPLSCPRIRESRLLDPQSPRNDQDAARVARPLPSSGGLALSRPATKK